jgi:multidrug efflux pump subunit AcrA (membrane-fusion protein)
MMNVHSSMTGPRTWMSYSFLIALIVCSGCSRGADKGEGIVVVNAPADGEVRRVLAHEGMEVVAGQAIAEIAIDVPASSTPEPAGDQRQARAGVSLQAAQAEVETARAEVVRHEVELQRLTSLVSSGQASQADVDGERALYEQASQRLEKAKAAVQEAQSGLIAARQPTPSSSTAPPVPVDQIVAARASSGGTVSVLNIRVGERVAAGQPLATIRAH